MDWTIILFALAVCIPMLMWPSPTNCCCVTCDLCRDTCTELLHSDMPTSFTVVISGLTDSGCTTCDTDDGTYSATVFTHPDTRCYYNVSLSSGTCLATPIRVEFDVIGKVSVTYQKTKADAFSRHYCAKWTADVGCITCSDITNLNLPLVSQGNCPLDTGTGFACATTGTPTCSITAVP